MLSITSHREEQERLLIDRDRFPVKFEAGNPFMVSQKYDLLPETAFAASPPENVKRQVDLEISVNSFRNEQIELALNRLSRMPENLHQMNNLGIAYLNRGDFDSAIGWFQKVLDLDNKFFPASANLAKAYFLKGEIEKALEIYLRMERIEPSNTRVLNNIASILIAKKELKEAYDYLEQVIRLDAKNVPGLHNAGTVLLAEGDFDKAIMFYRRALNVKSDLPGTLNNLGVCFAMRKNFKKAIKHFLAAWHINKQEVGTLCNLARAYQERGSNDKAIKVLEDYLSAGYDDKRVRDALAWSYASVREFKNGLMHLKRSVTMAESDRSRAEVFNNMATIYQCMKDYKNAEKFYSLCLENKALRSPIVFYNAIRFYFTQNNDRVAKKLIDEALILFPNDPYILETLGRYYYEVGDYSEALETLTQAIDIKPEIIDAYATLSVIEMEVNRDTEKAHEILLKGLSFNPTNLVLLNNLAYNYLLSNRPSDARQILDKVDKQDNPFLAATRGLLLISEGNIREGRRLYNLALALIKGHTGLARLIEQKKLLEIGKHYLKEGNRGEAVRLFKRAFRIKSKYSYFRDQIKELIETV